MPSLVSLPTELQACLAEYLHLPQVLALSATCRSLRQACAGLRSQQVNECNLLIQECATGTYHPEFWLRLVILILSHQLPAQCITEVRFSDQQEEERSIPENSADEYDPQYVDDALADLQQPGSFLRNAIIASPWIVNAKVHYFFDRVNRGSEDYIMPLLLPLLPNLRHLNVPSYPEQTAEFLRRVALAQAASDLQSPSVPFRKLVLLSTGFPDYQMDFPLAEEWQCAMHGLRSLRRIVMWRAVDKSFGGWPSTAVRPTCPEVFINMGSISVDAIKEFAAGWDAPCTMRQIWESPLPYAYDREDPSWKWCTVNEISSNKEGSGESQRLFVVTQMEDNWKGKETAEDAEDMRRRGIATCGDPDDPTSLSTYVLDDWRKLARSQ